MKIKSDNLKKLPTITPDLRAARRSAQALVVDMFRDSTVKAAFDANPRAVLAQRNIPEHLQGAFVSELTRNHAAKGDSCGFTTCHVLSHL